MDWIFDTQYLVFSGGGVRALAFIGVYHVLQYEFFKRKLDLSKQIFGYAGCSAGALFALLLCLGCTLTEMLTEFITFDENQIFSSLNPSNLFLHWGLDDKMYLVQHLRNILKKYAGNKDITFAELFQKTQKKLIVCTVRLNDETVQNFSAEKTPDFLVWRAVSASMAIPVLFSPNFVESEDVYIDGGFLNNLPYDVFDLQKTASFLLTRKLPYKIDGLQDYLLRVAYISTNACNKMHISLIPKEHYHRIITIDTGDASSVNFSLTEQDKHNIVFIGMQEMNAKFHPTSEIQTNVIKFVRLLVFFLRSKIEK